MNQSKIVFILLLTFCLNGFAGQKGRILKNPFFVFNNGLNKQDLPFIPYDEQATMLKKYGFDGIEHRETLGMMELKEAFGKQGLKICADYLKIDIDQKEPYLPEWKEVIPKLEGTGIILWCHLHSAKFKPSDEAADTQIVPILQELADFAKPYGVKLAIYPHIWFLAEKAEDSYRIAKKVDRENVGAVFNLPHFLRTDSEENIDKVISLILPKLFAVSICGADGGDTNNMDWDRLIQPLGKGTFDVFRLVELLAEKGFQGSFGLQCYGLKGDPETYLSQSGEVWNSFKTRYAQPLNSLDFKEKSSGWKLLFDGKSTKQWRAINEKSFPKVGWKVENGELCISGDNVLAESKNIGDIVTEKMYGNFELVWDWKMLTKGGNSGLKYFVIEGLSENPKHGEGLEYQLLDDKNHPWMLEGKMKPNDFHTVGSLYELYAASADKRPSPLGLWNQSRVVSNNNNIEHWLNGKKVLEYERGSNDFKEQVAKSKMNAMPGFGLAKEGHILLQDHGSIVHFRNIKIKELK
jgi:sugar phosphate isomerase/epimerase